MLLCVENAPEFGEDDDEDVISFIDKYITCKKPNNDPELEILVNRQVHRHSHTCRKKYKNVCRFNYPQPPMRRTRILYLLDSDVPNNEVTQHKDRWKNIQKYLNDLKEGEDVTYDQLLQTLNVSEDDYILAVQSTLSSPTIFLKRAPNELRINNYNPACLSAWRANMDIQFVLDTCVAYIVS